MTRPIRRLADLDAARAAEGTAAEALVQAKAARDTAHNALMRCRYAGAGSHTRVMAEFHDGEMREL